jgi:hypothetical protein
MLPAPRANRSRHEVPVPYRIWGYRGQGRRRYPADSRGRRLRARGIGNDHLGGRQGHHRLPARDARAASQRHPR